MKLADLTDEEIIYKLQEFDYNPLEINADIQPYYEVIFNRYYKNAYNLCRYYGLQPNDVEDIVQESFLKLYKSVKSFQKGKVFKYWFFRIVMNELKDKCKNNKKHTYDDFLEIHEASSGEKNISEEFQNREYLRGIISRLPEKLRKVILLKVYSDMEYDEIAKAENISSRQVRNRLEQAYSLVREYMEKEYE